ncbi:metallophosphatase family protein [archaeon]|nr:metallophosphatase family protein [archaeon]
MKILAIGDVHGNISTVKKIPHKGIDLILLTGDIGKSDLLRNMYFKNLKRIKKGLTKKEYSPLERKKAFMEVHNSTLEVVNYLRKIAPVYLISGNVECSNQEVRGEAREIGRKLPLTFLALRKMPNVRVINNRTANFKGVRIGGLKFFVDVNWVQ